MPARLLHTGQVVVDLVMALDNLPRSGGDVLARSAQFEVGGGFNVMAAASRNGLRTLYLGRHGAGRFGDLARQAMAVEGIQVAAPVSTAARHRVVGGADRTVGRALVHFLRRC